jgi:hypothetical protein
LAIVRFVDCRLRYAYGVTMPGEMIQGIVGVVVLLAAAVYLVRKRWPPAGPVEDVGQPPDGAEPIAQPRLQDIGFATYELPLPDPESDPEHPSG